MEPALASSIRKFDLTDSEYTPISAPIPCNFYLIVGNDDGTAMRRSSDGTDAHSYVMPAYGWYASIGTPVPMSNNVQTGRRFAVGQIVTYLKAIQGVGPVTVEFSL